MADDWRLTEALKQLRQMVTCPLCGALVSTTDGYNIHLDWHDGMTQYVSSVDSRLAQFSDYIINPETGLQRQFQDRLDVITNYVTAPDTGLESRVTVAIAGLQNNINSLTTAANEAVDSVRQDATTAIQANSDAITQLRSDATGAITGLSTRVSTLEALPHA